MRIFYKRLLSLGIAIGVFCSLLVFTAGQKQWTAIQLRNKILESDLYKIVNKTDSDTVTSMTLNDVKRIREALPEDCLSDYEAIGAIAAVTYRGEPLSGNVIGTGYNYSKLMNAQLIKGRYFTEEEVESKQKVCVLRSSFYDLIKSGRDNFIDINGQQYEIIGIFTEGTSGDSNWLTGDVFVPVTAFYQYIEDTPMESALIYQLILDKGNYSKEQILTKLTENAARDGLDISSLKLMPLRYDEFQEVSEYIKTFLVVFIISLLILIISVLNIIHIVTASILDREREIGLKTALGASARQIILEVSAEVYVCALKGGVLGTTIAAIANTIINYEFKQFSLSFNIVTIIAGILLAGLAGLIASILPAYKAAKIDPIAALKEE